VTTCVVFLPSLEAHLHESELALDDPKWMPDSGANAGPSVLGLLHRTLVPT
jgi:hypothetical protein